MVNVIQKDLSSARSMTGHPVPELPLATRYGAGASREAVLFQIVVFSGLFLTGVVLVIIYFL